MTGSPQGSRSKNGVACELRTASPRALWRWHECQARCTSRWGAIAVASEDRRAAGGRSVGHVGQHVEPAVSAYWRIGVPRTSTHWMGLEATPSCDSWSMTFFIPLFGTRTLTRPGPPTSVSPTHHQSAVAVLPVRAAACSAGGAQQ